MIGRTLDSDSTTMCVVCQQCGASGPRVNRLDYPAHRIAMHDADAEALRAGWLVETGDGECRVLCPGCRG